MIVKEEDHSPLIEVFVWVARTSGEGGGGTERFPCLGWSTFSTKLFHKRKQTSEHGASCAPSAGIVGGSALKVQTVSCVRTHLEA